MIIKLLSFLKKNWQTVLVFLAAVIVVWQVRSFFIKREDDLLNQMQEIDAIHKTEIDEIKKAYSKEKEQTEKNIKKLQEDLKSSEERYNSLLDELELKKKINIEKIVKTYKDNPVGLAKKVQDVLGFEIVMPESE